MSEINDWLIQFYKRFNKDVKLLLSKEPFWEICHSCPDGYCCRRSAIPVMTPEWNNIIRYVRDNLTNRNKNRYFKNVMSQEIQCPFLFDNRCLVYPVRPWACRIYPYVVSFYSTPLVIQSGNFIPPSCPTLAKSFGVNQGEITLCKAIPLEKDETRRLLKCQLQQPKPLWLIDASDYFQEYDKNMPKNANGTLEGSNMHEWLECALKMKNTGQITQAKLLKVLGMD